MNYYFFLLLIKNINQIINIMIYMIYLYKFYNMDKMFN